RRSAHVEDLPRVDVDTDLQCAGFSLGLHAARAHKKALPERGSSVEPCTNSQRSLLFMSDKHLRADGARVLADLNTLRSFGAYKTGVHMATFSEPHMRSLRWLAERLPEARLSAAIDGIGNVLGTSVKAGPNCWRARIWRARTMQAGSMGRLASSMLWKL